jgi:inorganic pyrophosphatase
MDEPTFPGCVVECFLIGVVEADQEEGGKINRNDRLLAVAKASEFYGDVRDISDLNPRTVKQIEGFFVNYQALRDVRVKVLGRRGPEAAKKTLDANRSKAA